jgi:hypothetical protein
VVRTKRRSREFTIQIYPCHHTCVSWGRSAYVGATKEYSLNSEMEENDAEKRGSHEEIPTDRDFQGPASGSPHKLTQNKLNDLVSDLELPKVKAKLIASRIKLWKYLDEGVKITLYRYLKKN